MQIVSSNIRYILDIILINKNVFIMYEILYMKIKFIITCPAVIFAASRKLRVSGRTKILVSSTSTRNGLSHIGALLGNRCAIKFFVRKVALLIINSIHIGSPIDRVNRI